jgi:anti-anti-sigma regulatory factor
MKIADLDLGKMLEFKPESGEIKLGNDRMLLFRQDAFATLRRLLYHQLGDQLARAILTQFGYSCGQGDFEALSKQYDWDTDADRLGSGPVLHSWEGLVHSSPEVMEFDLEAGTFFHRGIWHNSYEAQVHLSEFGVSETPVCHSLVGYAIGWCSAFLGKGRLMGIETKCLGAGDDVCQIVVKPESQWKPEEIEAQRAALDSTSRSVARELEMKLATIEEQAAAIRELSTPVMEIWEDVLVLPVVGVVDTKRSMDIMNNLLERIVQTQSKCVIIDITGVEIVDTRTADYLLRVSRAANLLGTRCVLTGLSPAVAQTLVEIGADLTEVRTLRNLKDGLKDCLFYLKKLKGQVSQS